MNPFMHVPQRLGEALKQSAQLPQPIRCRVNSVTVVVLNLLQLLLTRGNAHGIATAAAVNEFQRRQPHTVAVGAVRRAAALSASLIATALPREPAPFSAEQCSRKADGSALAASTAAAGAVLQGKQERAAAAAAATVQMQALF